MCLLVKAIAAYSALAKKAGISLTDTLACFLVGTCYIDLASLWISGGAQEELQQTLRRTSSLHHNSHAPHGAFHGVKHPDSKRLPSQA